ncbi:hypothetical protein C7H19_11625 [Aphanothece hegewaldii CCALA 016]|uniref:DUF1269 domain-containing protein n=1 Tax=Aphanothece hegewaldii CCALA 016 TaxID=2107694 RepID=A0A2T1LXH1_9CHRO|nr:hypothetical protein [Aphanothece hegewaldii]PSF37082.1 hypothetical protein C7H19_11625 [Aphanothece hegewaldii CCALA 016]
MAIENVDTESQSFIFAFIQKEAAERAYQILIENGLSEKQVMLDFLLADTVNIEQSEAMKSAAGGALVGTVLGGLIGLLISLPGYISASAGDGMSQMSPVGVILLGSGVGAAAIGLIAGLSGINAPKTNLQDIDESKTYQYRVIIGGEKEYEQAQEILQEKGMIANA